jgi:lysophospholipase L1-like esterase
MKVYGGTITPTKGNGWFSFFHEAIRQTVNAWIRTPGNFDEVIDFDKMARDPQDDQKLKAEYSDDWLHLNPKGYDEMGKFAAKYFEK